MCICTRLTCAADVAALPNSKTNPSIAKTVFLLISLLIYGSPLDTASGTTKPTYVATYYLERDTVAYARVPTALQDDAELMSARCVVQKRVNAHTVEENCGTPAVIKGDVQSSNSTSAMLERSVGNSDVRGDWQSSVMFQTLT